MDSDKEDMKRQKKASRKTLYACAVGTACSVSVAYSLAGLQSSINLRESLGATCMAIRLASAALGGLIASPFSIKRFGPKRTLIASELADMLFTVANFYPNWYTMPIASAISGFGSGVVWIASQTIVQSISKSAEEDFTVETQKRSGIFFGIIAIGQMVLNGITQLILRYSFSGQGDEDNTVSTSKSVTRIYDNSSYSDVTDISSCGSRDCPAEYAYLKETPKFELFSPNQDAVYLLLSVYLFMQFIAVLTHSLLLPPTPPDDVKESSEDSDDDISSSRENLIPGKSSAWKDLIRGTRDVFSYFLFPPGLLIFPAQFLFGLTVSFVWAEFNRAFVSCIIGVAQVGATTLILGLSSLLTSAIISRIANRFDMTSIMVTGMIFDTANYTASLLWVPSNVTMFLPYVFAAFYGISYGIRRNTSFLIATRYTQDHAIAFSAQSVSICLGEIVSFAWSTPLCVYVKIYVLIGLVIFATACWGLAEHRHRRLANSTS